MPRQDCGTYDSMMPHILGASLAISATSSLSKSIPPATRGKLYMTLSPTAGLADNPASRQKKREHTLGSARLQPHQQRTFLSLLDFLSDNQPSILERRLEQNLRRLQQHREPTGLFHGCYCLLRRQQLASVVSESSRGHFVESGSAVHALAESKILYEQKRQRGKD